MNKNFKLAYRHKKYPIFEVDKDGHSDGRYIVQYSAKMPINLTVWELIEPAMMPREETYKPFFKPNRRAEEVPYFAY